MNSSTTSPTNEKPKSHPFWRWFWLSFLVVSLAYAGYSFYVPSNDIDWAKDMVSAQEIADDSDKHIMLFFTGEWCSPCRVMKREIFANDEAMKIINSQVVPLMIDFDDPNTKELVEQYNIGGTPITVFTDSKGEVIDYGVGKVGRTEFLDMIANLGNKAS